MNHSIEMCVKFGLTAACGVVPVPGLYNQRECALQRKESMKKLINFKKESGEIMDEITFTSHYEA